LKTVRSLAVPALALSLLGGAAAPSFADTLVVANKSEATLSMVDLMAKRVIFSLPTGKGPHEVEVSPNGRLALVADYGVQDSDGSTLTVIDLPTARVVKTIDLGEYRRPHGVVWLDNRRALVTAEVNKALIEVDVDEGKVVRALPTAQDASHMVAVTKDGSRAFVSNLMSGSMTAFDLKTGRKIKDVKTGAGAEGIAVTPDGKQVWVTNRAADTVSVVDANSLKVLATLPSAKFPIRAEATPDGKHVLVSNAQSGDLSVFTVKDRKLARRIPLKAQTSKDGKRLFDFGDSPTPIGIQIAPNGKRAYVALANADKIAVIDLVEWRVTDMITPGKEPDGMGYSILDAGMAVRPVG
jgi:YVTN family beta-propeller protein